MSARSRSIALVAALVLVPGPRGSAAGQEAARSAPDGAASGAPRLAVAGQPGGTGAEAGAAGVVHRVEREAWSMGTRLGVSIRADSRAAGLGLSERAITEVERLDRLLSTWDARSPMSRLNASAAGAPVALPSELVGLLAEAERWAERTGRAFDPTVGPLVGAWGLRGDVGVVAPASAQAEHGGSAMGPERSAASVPSPATIARARAAVGAGRVVLDTQAGTAAKTSAQAWLDTGGFGKGAALRSVGALLRADAVRSAVVDLGGQLLVLGAPAPGLPVAIAHPVDRDRTAALLRIVDGSVATSGHGERPGHVLDPRTGRPTPPWGSVTVVHDDALAADALATALHVMGPGAGPSWASERGVAALFLVADDSGEHAIATEAIRPYLGGDAALSSPDHPTAPR